MTITSISKNAFNENSSTVCQASATHDAGARHGIQQFSVACRRPKKLIKILISLMIKVLHSHTTVIVLMV